MTRGPYSLRGRRRLALLLLPALLLRAFIPAGFMPVPHSPFVLEICPEGFPRQLLGHAVHHHDHDRSGAGGQSEHSIFGSAGAAPLPEFLAGSASAAAPAPLALPAPASVFFVRLVHLPEPRGPPSV